MSKEEILAEATSVYDNYVEALETGTCEALQSYARNLSERIIPRGVETHEVVGIVLLLRDVLARSLFSKYRDDFGKLNRILDANELMDKLRETQPDIVILDIAMPGKSGLDVLKEIKEFYPQLPVLMLSMHPEDRFAIRSLKAGASGYLTKSSISDQMVKAIRKIVEQKKKYITPELAEQLANRMDLNNDKLLHESLSDREYQVLCMIASGKNVSEIAEELTISVQTVHTYRSRIKSKINLSSNVEITRYAIENNLID